MLTDLRLISGVPIRFSADTDRAIRRFQLVSDVAGLVYIVIIEHDTQATLRAELDPAFQVVRRQHVEFVLIDGLINHAGPFYSKSLPYMIYSRSKRPDRAISLVATIRPTSWR